jgi:hypothetical protein
LGVDQKGRAWIISIRFAEQNVNSYGMNNQFIDAGILVYKPLDYSLQLGALDPYYKIPFNGEYYDITPALGALKPIAQFIKQTIVSYVLPDPAATRSLENRRTFLEEVYDPINGIMRFPNGEAIDLKIKGLFKEIPELSVKIENDSYTFQLEYPGYRLLVRNYYKHSKLEVEAVGNDFHYKEHRIGGLGGIQYTLERFKYSIQRERGLLSFKVLVAEEEQKKVDELDNWILKLVNGGVEDLFEDEEDDQDDE